jgi:predicted esterase
MSDHRMLASRVLLLVLLAGCSTDAATQRGAVLDGMPTQVRPAERYVIYLHGRILEDKPQQPVDERFGAYAYDSILTSLAAAGAQVISERRDSATDFQAYGRRVAEQVRGLMAAGVPAERITVVGFSKGGAIAMVASALLADQRIGFVLLAPCGDWMLNRADVDVRGRILSIYEASDELGTTCAPLFERASAPGVQREIRISTGAGHGAFFRPRPEWVRPVLDWIAADRN